MVTPYASRGPSRVATCLQPDVGMRLSVDDSQTVLCFLSFHSGITDISLGQVVEDSSLSPLYIANRVICDTFDSRHSLVPGRKLTYLLGPDSIQCITILDWNQRLEIIVANGHWVEAVNAIKCFYEGCVSALISYPKHIRVVHLSKAVYWHPASNT